MTRIATDNKVIAIFKPVKFIIILAIIVSAISISLFYIFENDEDTKSKVRLSPNSLWGVVTAIFVHKDANHLWSNVVGLAANTFIVGTAIHMNLLHRSRTRLFISTTVVMAIITNILWISIVMYLGRGSETAGASGLVYAIQGGALSFFVTNMTDALALYRAKQGPIKKSKASLVTNALMVTTLLIFIVLFRDLFLGVADGVNVFAHAIGFFGAFVITMVREMMLSGKQSYQSYKAPSA